MTNHWLVPTMVISAFTILVGILGKCDTHTLTLLSFIALTTVIRPYLV